MTIVYLRHVDNTGYGEGFIVSSNRRKIRSAQEVVVGNAFVDSNSRRTPFIYSLGSIIDIRNWKVPTEYKPYYEYNHDKGLKRRLIND